ncbi:MAG: carboxypeptidase regulatory-like domain-containing protein [Bacteroidota bacterium]
MTAIDQLRLAALIRLQVLCETLVLLLTPIDGYTELKVSLDKAIKKIKEARAINEASIKDKAVLKQDALSAMVVIVTHFLQIAQLKAHSVGAADLIAALNFPKTYLKKADDSVVGVRAEEIKNIIKANLTILTNILPADITSMEEAIAYYNILESAPKDAIDYRKVKGTDPIPNLLNLAEIPRDYIGKIFYSSLTDYVDQYEKAIKIGKPVNRRHISSIISFVEAETGVPMQKVKTTFTLGDKEHIKISTSRGYARFTALPEGNYTLSAEFEGYTPILKNNVAISDNQILKLTFKLQKIVLTNSLSVLVCDKETSTPLKEAKLYIPSIAFSTLTNADGIAQKPNLLPATYQAVLTMPGFRDIDFTFTIDAQQKLNLEFLMEKL